MVIDQERHDWLKLLTVRVAVSYFKTVNVRHSKFKLLLISEWPTYPLYTTPYVSESMFRFINYALYLDDE